MLLILWLVLVVVATDVGAYFVGRSVGRCASSGRRSVRARPGRARSAAWSPAALVGARLRLARGRLAPDPHRPSQPRHRDLRRSSAICSRSAVKRRFGVKDASRLIPGHGGVMDRLDGVMGGVWFFAICDALGVGVIGA